MGNTVVMSLMLLKHLLMEKTDKFMVNVFLDIPWDVRLSYLAENSWQGVVLDEKHNGDTCGQKGDRQVHGQWLSEHKF